MTVTEEGLDIVAVARARLFIESDAGRIRRDAMLSSAEVAVALGTSPLTIRNWERGRSRPRAASALAYYSLLVTLGEARWLDPDEQIRRLRAWTSS